MKNRLLTLLALCGATLCATTAQASDKWPDPTVTFTEPDLTEDVTGGGEYYIYHVATGMYMTNGNYKNTGNWGTELVVGAEGQKVTLSYGLDYELSHRAETDPEYSTAKGWRMSMKEAKSNSGHHELFIHPSLYTVCVDHDKKGHILWKITPNGDGTYRIKVIDEDKLYGAEAQDGIYKNTFMAVNEGETGVDPLLDTQTAGHENGQPDWKFVAVDVYEACKAKKQLQEQLDAADAAGFTATGEYGEVYNNSAATVEEVEKAVEDLKAALLDFQYGAATPENPVDMTNLISQPSFDESYEGWTLWTARPVETGENQVRKTGDNMTANDGKECVNFFEYWIPSSKGSQPDWSITQNLTGLQDGKYRLGAHILTNDTEAPKGRFLMARTLAGEVRREADVQALVDSAHSNGYFAHYDLEFSVVRGTATIGMVVEGASTNWTAVDNFTLEYLGKSEAVMGTLLQQNIDEAKAKYQEYTNYNEHFSQAGKTNYEATIKKAQDAVDGGQASDEELLTLISEVQACMDSLSKDVAAYQMLSTKYKELEDAYYEKFGDVELTSYLEYLVGLNDAWENGTFDPAEVDSIQPRADRILKEAVREALTSGAMSDVTPLLVNPDFTGNHNGWTNTGSGDFKDDNSGVAELWNGQGADGEVYQELTGLPSGSYKITANAIFSPSSNKTFSGWNETYGQEGDTKNEILGSLFGNDASTKIHHVMDYPLTAEEVGENTEGFELIDWGEYAGRDMYMVRLKPGANRTFEEHPDYFLSEVACYVADDGKLRLGIRMATANVDWTGAWACFDKFRVEYLGAGDMSGAYSSLEALIAQATEMRDKKEVITTQEALDGLNAAIETANGIVGGELTLETYNGQMEALNAAIDAAQEAIDAATALDARASGHSAKYDEYLENYDPDAVDELMALLDEITEKTETGLFASMQEIEDYDGRIDRLCAAMMSGSFDGTGAGKDTPADATGFIINPSFQTTGENAQGEITEVPSADGWKATGGTATSGLCYEIYNDSSEIHQTLYGMPAGYYRLSYQGFYRAGLSVPAAVAHRDGTEKLNAEVYVEAGGNQWTAPLASIFEGVGEYKYTTEDPTLADSLFPADRFPELQGLNYYHVVVNVTGAKMIFDEGLYAGGFSFHVAEGEEPVLGVRKTGKIADDWACFDNFKLEYYGDGDANKPDDFGEPSGIDGTLDGDGAATVSTTWYTIGGARVAQPARRGLYIRQDKKADGTVKTVKVLVK